MGTLKQTICCIILITFIAFSCDNNAKPRPKDVTITLKVKADQLFNETNPDKMTIEKYCSLDDKAHSSVLGQPLKDFTTEVYNTKFVLWESELDPNNLESGYSVEITHIVRSGTPKIINKNVITRGNGNGKLKAKVIKNKDVNEYIIHFRIIAPDGAFKDYIIDPMIKGNP